MTNRETGRDILNTIMTNHIVLQKENWNIINPVIF